MDARVDELIQEYVAAGGDYRDWRPSFSIAPTTPVLIVRERPGGRVAGAGADLDPAPAADPTSDPNPAAQVLPQRTIDVARWDFRPPFIDPTGRPNFNARIERLTSSGLWRGAFTATRALVPMRGYFEWTGTPGDKQPHFLHAPDGGLLAAAGIYTSRRVGDEVVLSVAIITRPARDASGEIHDRMPVFLGRDTWNTYLDPTPLDEAGRTHLLGLITRESDRMATEIVSHPVDRKVNNVHTADPADATFIAPLA